MSEFQISKWDVVEALGMQFDGESYGEDDNEPYPTYSFSYLGESYYFIRGAWNMWEDKAKDEAAGRLLAELKEAIRNRRNDVHY